MSADERRVIDTSKAHPARVYDVFLGGKNNYPADREAAKAALAANPRGYLDVRHNRDFLRRAVTHVATETGIGQFLDIGTGLPTQENVHQIAQGVSPQARVVYVDNDPVVLAHARALLTSGPEGRTAYVHADLRDPDTILREAARTLDFGRPTALVLVAILHFIEDRDAYDNVTRLLGALPPGSALILGHLTADLNPETIAKVAETYRKRGFSFVLRPRDDLRRFVTDNGLALIEPGIVPAHRWRPDHTADAVRATGADQEYVESLEPIDQTKYFDITDVTDADINVYGLVAYKN